MSKDIIKNSRGNCKHHWIINSENVGRCKHCPEVRDFGELLRKNGVFAAGRRGAKASKGVARSPYRKRRGREKKEEL